MTTNKQKIKRLADSRGVKAAPVSIYGQPFYFLYDSKGELLFDGHSLTENEVLVYLESLQDQNQ